MTAAAMPTLQELHAMAGVHKLPVQEIEEAERKIAAISEIAAEFGATTSSKFGSVAARQGGEVALIGRLVWVDRELGWATQWQMGWQGRTHRWRVRGVTFDEAFRRGIGGAAQILSDNGDPA